MTPDQEQAERERLLKGFHANRRAAHEVLFKHRHNLSTPDFHANLIYWFYSQHPKVVVEGFRDSAKSTVAEEAMVIATCYKEFRNAIIVGSSHTRACERLESIANELAMNPNIEWLFGKQVGDTWGKGKIVTASGVCIQALGPGMSMRGTKHLEARPDFALFDDLEDEMSTKDVDARDATMRWLYKVFLPALSTVPAPRVRFVGNRLDEDAVVVRLAKDEAWKHIQIPVMYQADDGVERYDLPPGLWKPMWGEKFPIEAIAQKRAEYERVGLLHEWNCEYMCQADDPQAHIFSASQIRASTQMRVWEPCFGAYDPARTATHKSAMTGKVVFSWIGSRLVVWVGDAQLWLPDQIIEDIFNVNDDFSPIRIGVEATGLEEFIMQPLRAEALKRRQLLPVERLIPPVGKQGFIKSLQPFFKAGAIDFVNVGDEARKQLLSFPTGRMDFPNALAYALMMRPGLPVYEDFGNDHVQPNLLRTQDKYWLVVNANHAYTTGVLVQLVGGQIRAHLDWILEGPPHDTIGEIAANARLEAGRSLGILAPPQPPGTHDTVGLRVALRANQLQCVNGGGILVGRSAIQNALTRRRRGEPLLLANTQARWTLNAFAGGFCWNITKRGEVERTPSPGPHQVLMEGLESFCAKLGVLNEAAEDDVRMAVGADGRPYRTIHAGLAVQHQELKDPSYGQDI